MGAAEREAAVWETGAVDNEAVGAAGVGSGRLLPLEPDRLLPPAVDRPLLLFRDAASLQASDVMAAI